MTASSSPVQPSPVASTAGEIPAAAGRRRLLINLYRHPRIQLGLLIAPPVGWFGIVYLGSLALLLVTAF
jgi:putative spermidine/putrescine transport system permease protein